MGPPLAANLEAEFEWNRKPDLWGFRGALQINELQNLEALSESPLIDRFPEAQLLLSYLGDIAALEFSGSLPQSGEKETTWRLKITDKEGNEYGLDFKIDSSTDPWRVSLELSPLDVDLERWSAFLPEDWHPVIPGSECKLLRFSTHGPWGQWSDWSASARLQIKNGEVALAPVGRQIRGLEILVDGQGDLGRWSGTAQVTADEFSTPGLPAPVKAIRARDLDFSFSPTTRDFTLGGPWSIEDGPGGQFSGTLSLSTEEGYRIEGKTDRFDLAEWNVHRLGNWSGSFRVEGPSLTAPPTSLSADLEGNEVVYGTFDLSRRPLKIHLKGNPQTLGTPTFDAFEIDWGTVFKLEMPGSRWGADVFDAENVRLSGDLLVLREFLPGFSPNPRLGQWVDPRKWEIRGGVRLTFAPFFTIETKNTILDTGRGQGGAFGFAYSQKTGLWRFNSPTLALPLADLARELHVPGLTVSGEASLKADLTGAFGAQTSAQEGWLRTAIVRADISQSDGHFGKINRDGSLKESVVGWRALNGVVRIDWSQASRKIEADLRFRDWFWFTRPGYASSRVPPHLSTPGARLKCIVTKDTPQSYQLNEFRFSQGEGAPIQTDITGSIAKKGNVWLPDLKVRIEGNGAKPTPVFRAVQLGGSGVFIGAVKPNRTHNWVLEGDLDCQDSYFEFVAGPFIAEGLNGKFFFRDIRLDELVSADRWNARKHDLPNAPVASHSVEDAFANPNARVNLQVDRIRVGETYYDNLTVRTLWVGEKLLLNTVEGKFAAGDYPFRLTGFLFFQPGYGAGWRLRGSTRRVPLNVAVPGFGGVGLGYEALEVDFYLYKDLRADRVETRYLSLGIPVGQLKDIPGFGKFLFGWTPDSLQTTDLIVKRVGNGPWEVLNPLDPTDLQYLPKYLIEKVPQGVGNQIQEKGTEFFEGVGDAFRDFFEPGK